MKIIKIEANPNGSHDNQDFHGSIPEGWALVPTALQTENFPFGEPVVEASAGGFAVVTGWAPRDMPTVAAPELTPEQLREQAYNTEASVLWEGKALTVTQAALLWQYYAAEGNDLADDLTALIAGVKAEIRARYPDEEAAV